ncbi:MAG: hypothetical protein IVW57_12275 [Ktedonobacterales bacterium]|nr:hypothetical protein [Ktedonobacterales bacterium]
MRRRASVRLSDTDMADLMALGDGHISEGIRRTLATTRALHQHDTLQTLSDIVRNLEPIFLRSLDAINVSFYGDHTTATLIFHLYTQGTTASAGPYVISFDDKNLPDGVTSMALMHWPDRTVPVTLRIPVETQIRDLYHTNLLGMVDAARFDADAQQVEMGLHPSATWIIKTHAGSLQERLDWLASLRQG